MVPRPTGFWLDTISGWNWAKKKEQENQTKTVQKRLKFKKRQTSWMKVHLKLANLLKLGIVFEKSVHFDGHFATAPRYGTIRT